MEVGINRRERLIYVAVLIALTIATFALHYVTESCCRSPYKLAVFLLVLGVVVAVDVIGGEYRPALTISIYAIFMMLPIIICAADYFR